MALVDGGAVFEKDPQEPAGAQLQDTPILLGSLLTETVSGRTAEVARLIGNAEVNVTPIVGAVIETLA